MDMTSVDSDGNCLFSNDGHKALGGLRGPRSEVYADRITMKQLSYAYDLYLSGLSVRKVASIIWQDTDYISFQSCASCLYSSFHRLGWPLRSRKDAAIASKWKHGRSRRGKEDPVLRREQARARGEVRGVRCEGVKTKRPRFGQQCRRPALTGGRFCEAHDPTQAGAVADRVAAMRAGWKPDHPGLRP